MKRFLVILSMLWFVAGPGHGSDLAREKRLADQIVDAVFTGEPVFLDTEGHRFLGIYTESETTPVLGGVIVLHGRGYHPDWENAVHPLRVGLAKRGWNTLSLQMPVLGKQARYYDYIAVFPEAFPRIEAGIRYLHDKDIKTVMLIAHSCSVHMSMAWLEQAKNSGIDAYVGIGMGATDYGQPMAKPLPLDRLKFPVLDLFGTDEYSAVLAAASGRLARIQQAGNPSSRQVSIPGTDHYFKGAGEPLVKAVGDWLEQVIRNR